MDGLLSKTAGDVINLASFAIGLLSLLLTFLLRPKRPRSTPNTKTGVTSPSLAAIRNYMREPIVRRFLYVEGALVVASTAILFPPGTVRTILAYAWGLLLLIQLIFILVLVCGEDSKFQEVFDEPGAWRYVLVFLCIIVTTSLLLSSGEPSFEAVRQYLAFNLLIPSLVSVVGLLGYLLTRLLEAIDFYYERKHGDHYTEAVRELTRKLKDK